MSNQTKEVIQRARQQLGFIQDALEDLRFSSNDTKKRQRAFANIIIFGRAVTFVLQNLRSVVGKDAFDEWYAPVQNEMRGDELLNAFKDARNNFEKQGRLQSSIKMNMHSFNSSMLQKYMADRPKNSKGFFIGDQFGGSGWEIEMPDGTIEKLYVDVDFGPGNVIINVFFIQPPVQHKGILVEDTSIENCCKLYFDYLQVLVEKAASKFIIK